VLSVIVAADPGFDLVLAITAYPPVVALLPVEGKARVYPRQSHHSLSVHSKGDRLFLQVAGSRMKSRQTRYDVFPLPAISRDTRLFIKHTKRFANTHARNCFSAWWEKKDGVRGGEPLAACMPLGRRLCHSNFSIGS
jgi:hypothetical protein